MRRSWIKMWVTILRDKQFMDNMNATEKWCWVGLLLLAGDSHYPGKICITESMGYSPDQLSKLLAVDPKVIDNTIDLMGESSVVRDSNGVITIVKWSDYQSEWMRISKYERNNTTPKTTPVTTPKTTRKKEKEKEIQKEKQSKTESKHLAEPETNPASAQGSAIATKSRKRPMSPEAVSCRSYFYQQFEMARGRKYVASFARDGVLFANLCSIIPEHQVKGMIDFYLRWDEPFVKQKGYTLSIFNAKINEIMELGIHKGKWASKHEVSKDIGDIIRQTADSTAFPGGANDEPEY